MSNITFDATLSSWEETWKRFDNKAGLLVGNGASRAVWEPFCYDSLYDCACCTGAEYRLTQEDQEIFEWADTRNFEQVLSAFRIATEVDAHFQIDALAIEKRYESIQRALGVAVRSVHVPYQRLDESIRQSIRDCLREYKFVYSTNYDLILYWSAMLKNDQLFKDYLWDGRFNLSNIAVWGNPEPTRMLYLHGALHLVRLPDGSTEKVQRSEFASLLEQFGQPREDKATPLFITEGRSKDKLKSILRSDYLSFAYTQFAMHKGTMTVFGHSLSKDYDGHLLDAMRNWPPTQIAIAMLPPWTDQQRRRIVQEKARLDDQLDSHSLLFFDATTHPLGNSNLRVSDCEYCW